AVRHVYTDADVPGLGKNVLTEPDRVAAVEAYRFHVRYYALLGLKEAVANGFGPAAGLLAAESDRDGWEYRRRILVDDFGLADVSAGLRELAEMAVQVARDTERARAKDDARGVRVIG